MNNTQTQIKVYDAVMGSGKTTFIIDHMNNNSNDRYIYITPNISECHRIDEACPMLNFQHPSDDKGTKLKDLQRLVEAEENIVSTHALLTHFTKETLELLHNRNYHLILDEVIEPCVQHVISETDIQMLFDSGYIQVANDGITLKWITDRPKHDFSLYHEYKLIENENLVIFDFNNSAKNKKVFIWEMTKGLFDSFLDVTILTYQFEGSLLRAYFDVKGIDYEVDTKTLDRGVKLGHLIKVCEHEGLNKIGQHKQALGSKLTKDPKKCKELGVNIYNYIKNIEPTASREIMWTTFKDAKGNMKGKGYTKGFIPHNMKATNEYALKTTLVYALNRYMRVPVKQYLEAQGIDVNEDLWALNELLQWVFRSAIRNDEPIKIYIPSRRMRELLLEWIEHH